MENQSWREILQTYKDQWIALTEWEEDEHGDIISGNVAFSAKNRTDFYRHVNTHFVNRDLAIRFTGNVRGPFFLNT